MSESSPSETPVSQAIEAPSASKSLAIQDIQGLASERIKELLRHSRAPSTLKRYREGWQVFSGWCGAHGRKASPPEPATIVEFLATWGMSGERGVPTVNQTLSAIAYASRLLGSEPCSHPWVREAFRALKRAKQNRPVGKAPVTLDLLERLQAQLDRSTFAGKRAAALLLVGWWGALRRTELVSLRVEDVARVPSGISLTIRHSKTDQEGRGQTVGLEDKGGDLLCPVRALRDWLNVADITEGFIFRAFTKHQTLRRNHLSDQEVGKLVKSLALSAGIDPRTFSGHSLRAGLVTEAYRQGVGEAKILGTTRHTSASALARYRRESDPVARGASPDIHIPRRPVEPGRIPDPEGSPDGLGEA